VNYNTAWQIKQKLMQVMMDREPGKRLSGRIAMDDAYFKWINTKLGNVKNSLLETNAIRDKHVPRYLAEF
jgi:hypothetical protein